MYLAPATDNWPLLSVTERASFVDYWGARGFVPDPDPPDLADSTPPRFIRTGDPGNTFDGGVSPVVITSAEDGNVLMAEFLKQNDLINGRGGSGGGIGTGSVPSLDLSWSLCNFAKRLGIVPATFDCASICAKLLFWGAIGLTAVGVGGAVLHRLGRRR